MARSPETQKSERLRQWFVSSSDTQKIVQLAWLSHELTIYGRCDWLELTGQEQTASFKRLNELQHRIGQDIGHLAQGTNRLSAEHYGLSGAASVARAPFFCSRSAVN